MQLPTAYEGYLENWSRVWRQTRFLGPGSAPAPRSAFQAHYDNVRDLSRLGSLFPASPLLI